MNDSGIARVGLLFSGQGSQKCGMGVPWQGADAWSVVETISVASGHDVAELLLRADDEALRRTDRAQIATFALEMVVLGHYKGPDRGVHDGNGHEIVACAGHSLGEYAALVAAEILDLRAAAGLVATRGAAMFAAAHAEPGTMFAVIGATTDAVSEALAPLQHAGVRAWVANLNAPDQTVVAGDRAGIERATDACAELGKVMALPVGGAFHSPLMAPAETALRAALARADFRPGRVPVVANVDATPHPGGREWVELLACQLTAPVRWTESIRRLVDECGCGAFVEIGPGNTLSNMVKRIARGTPTTRVTPP
jgi:[acyl-carrier-protein] S-malonyltransferase